MTENNRFTYMEQLNGYCDVYDNSKVLSCMRLEYVGKTVELLNNLNDENKQLKSENETYKNMFFEIVETALTDKNCRELYCKGILDIFDKANSLNQAREMIKEHLK